MFPCYQNMYVQQFDNPKYISNRLLQIVCDTEAKMPTIRKTMKTINKHTQRVSITAVISSGALSVNTKKY